MKDGALEGKSFDCYVLTEFFMKVETLYVEGINPIHGQIRSAMVGLTIKWNTFYSITHKSQSK